MGVDKSFLNVLQLGLAFMLVFTAFQTMGNIQKTILQDISEEDKHFTGQGYVSLAIIYALLAVMNWASPSIISLIGPKFSMVLGAVTYILFIMSFLLPKTYLLYLASALVGAGAAMIWTGQGAYLAQNSSPSTISRNSGLFWAMLQCSMFIGNLFVYFKFKGKDEIDKDSRVFVLWTLTGIGIAGLIVMILFRKPPQGEIEVDEEPAEKLGPVESFKEACKLFVTKEMLLLSITFFYTGIELSFFSGVYSSSIGNTGKFESRKELVGLSGIFIGLGEVIAGASFGILGAKTTKWGRDPVVIGGFVIHIVAYFLIFLNLPNKSPFADTFDDAIITSNVGLAIFCSFLLGFGDACYNTQIYSVLGGVYSKQSSAAFAIFKFIQSVAAAICFAYASELVLYGQLGILLALAILGTGSFVWVEWTFKKRGDASAVDTHSQSGSE